MKKRLSGNYFERLLFNVLPWTFFMVLCLLLISKKQNSIIPTFLIATFAFWAMDTIIIFLKFKNPKQLISQEKRLLLGREEIELSAIKKITPITDKRYRWGFRMVKIEFLNGTKKFIIDKPEFIISDLSIKPSKTIRILISMYPELQQRIMDRHFI